MLTIAFSFYVEIFHKQPQIAAEKRNGLLRSYKSILQLCGLSRTRRFCFYHESEKGHESSATSIYFERICCGSVRG